MSAASGRGGSASGQRAKAGFTLAAASWRASEALMSWLDTRCPVTTTKSRFSPIMPAPRRSSHLRLLRARSVRVSAGGWPRGCPPRGHYLQVADDWHGDGRTCTPRRSSPPGKCAAACRTAASTWTPGSGSALRPPCLESVHEPDHALIFVRRIWRRRCARGVCGRGRHLHMAADGVALTARLAAKEKDLLHVRTGQHLERVIHQRHVGHWPERRRRLHAERLWQHRWR